MNKDTKLRDGFRVYGWELGGQREHLWYFPTLIEAKAFATFIAAQTGEEYDVMQYLGSSRRAELPVEWVEAMAPSPPSPNLKEP